MKGIWKLLFIALLLAACNQPYQSDPVITVPTAPGGATLAAQLVGDWSAQSVQVTPQPGMFLEEEPQISVSVCHDANVYAAESETSQILYVIPAGAQFKAYAVSSQWVTVFPVREWPGHKSQGQYIKAGTLC